MDYKFKFHEPHRATIKDEATHQAYVKMFEMERKLMQQQGQQPGLGAAPMQQTSQGQDGVVDFGGQGMKPGWKNLRSGFGTPVKEFTGRLTSWKTIKDNFGNWQVVLDYADSVIHLSDQPYSSTDVTLQIKHSDQVNSGWGKFGASVAQITGQDIENLDIDALIGQTLLMFRVDGVQYGINRETGKPMTGNIWNVVAILQPGQQPNWSTSGGGVAGQVDAPNTAVTKVVTGGEVDVETYTRSLANGKDKASFMGAALGDPKTRVGGDGPGSVTARILDGSYLDTEITQGRVTIDANGIHHVV